MSGGRLFVLAGHDPTGGAGVDADGEAARHFGVESDAVVTAWTDQGGGKVRSIGPREPSDWRAEVERRCLADAPVWKVGLLPGEGHVRELADLLRETRLRNETQPAPLDPLGGWGLGMVGGELGVVGGSDEPRKAVGPEGGISSPSSPETAGERQRSSPRHPLLVLDPVLQASGGEPFLDDAGVRTLREELLPHGPLLTPNLPEAARLTGRAESELASPAVRLGTAQDLLAAGAAGVFLKGGHGAEDPVLDLVLIRGAPPVWHERRRTPGGGIHGSGCRYASALAAGLLLGWGPAEASRRAGEWVGNLIRDRSKTMGSD